MPHSVHSPPAPHPDPPAHRTLSAWIKLLAVWVAGLCVWGIYFWIIILLLIRLSS